MAQTLEHNEVITQVVPITVPSCDVDVTVIQKLDDEPNDVGGLTAAELKAKFDETNAAVKSYINDELIPAVVGADATEQARAAAEAERVANEIERVSNETTRVNAETTRGNNETARQSAETTRGNNETARQSAETTRGNNETTRVRNETTRQNNEAARVLAEEARENAETGYVAQCATSAQDAEAWAVGKRGGVNVGEGDPAYHNNALYWKEQAQQAAGGDKLDKTGDGSNVTAAFTAASSRTNIATGEKLSVLFGKIAKWFSDLGSLAFKSTVAKTDLASNVQTSLEKADSALQSVTKSDVGLGNVDNVKQYSASNPPPYPVTSVNGQTGEVTVNVPTVPSTTNILKGNGSGGVVAATRGSDYIASGNIVKQTLVSTETTPAEDYAINWVYGN